MERAIVYVKHDVAKIHTDKDMEQMAAFIRLAVQRVLDPQQEHLPQENIVLRHSRFDPLDAHNSDVELEIVTSWYADRDERDVPRPEAALGFKKTIEDEASRLLGGHYTFHVVRIGLDYSVGIPEPEEEP